MTVRYLVNCKINPDTGLCEDAKKTRDCNFMSREKYSEITKRIGHLEKLRRYDHG